MVINTSTLSDRIVIEELRAAYCYHLDDGEVERLVDLFTEDAVIHYASLEEPLEGYDDLRGLLIEWTAEPSQVRRHTVSNPIINVDDDTATGTWYYRAVTLESDGRGLLEQGRYHDEYRYVEGTWKISRMETTVAYGASVTMGWADVRPHQ
jgi:ketosteroid isomerase-like protein